MSYRIVRFYRDADTPAKAIHQLGDLSMADAKRHCSKESSRGPVQCGSFGRMHFIKQTADTKPQFCPVCGAGTVAEWFDGFTEN